MGEEFVEMTWDRFIVWGSKVVVAGILAQTLYFKFTYAPETRVIFGELGGRPAATAVGLIELVCVVLLLVPTTGFAGAFLSLAVISGAIMTHLTRLGIEIVDPETRTSDGGLLFALAVTVAVGSLLILWLERASFLSLTGLARS
jgi:hypothetical protein